MLSLSEDEYSLILSSYLPSLNVEVGLDNQYIFLGTLGLSFVVINQYQSVQI
jgi:hypothetical protein